MIDKIDYTIPSDFVPGVALKVQMMWTETEWTANCFYIIKCFQDPRWDTPHWVEDGQLDNDEASRTRVWNKPILRLFLGFMLTAWKDFYDNGYQPKGMSLSCRYGMRMTVDFKIAYEYLYDLRYGRVER